MDVVVLLTAVVAAAVLVIVITMLRQLAAIRRSQPLDAVVARLEALERSQERIDRTLRDETARLRDGMGSDSGALRAEVVQAITTVAGNVQQQLEAVRSAVDTRLRNIQDDNAQRLEQMRATVDEKLQGTLEKRLGESFQQVSTRLEQVHQGLGEMRSLAEGVGDLKKVLTNVKTRGTWGEVQLGALLEQMLSPEQYDRNVAVTGGLERVEYAIRLPGREQGDGCVYLPIDAKFPQEDYLRLVDASERADAESLEIAARQLEARLRACAAEISRKYVSPPRTTDFAVLYLPTEGLYAEALRRSGLAESLMRDCRVLIAGPTTFGALLNSLQVGFRTLAIQKRSSEVWDVLGSVKAEFAKYATVLDKVRKKLDEASHTVDDAARRTRVLQRTLREVETTSPEAAPDLLSDLDDDDVLPALPRAASRN